MLVKSLLCSIISTLLAPLKLHTQARIRAIYGSEHPSRRCEGQNRKSTARTGSLFGSHAHNFGSSCKESQSYVWCNGFLWSLAFAKSKLKESLVNDYAVYPSVKLNDVKWFQNSNATFATLAGRPSCVFFSRWCQFPFILCKNMRMQVGPKIISVHSQILKNGVRNCLIGRKEQPITRIITLNYELLCPDNDNMSYELIVRNNFLLSALFCGPTNLLAVSVRTEVFFSDWDLISDLGEWTLWQASESLQTLQHAGQNWAEEPSQRRAWSSFRGRLMIAELQSWESAFD